MFSTERRLSAPSTQQAVGSSTFTTPHLDGSLALHEIYDFHLEHSPTHPLFTWDSETLGSRTLTWGEVARGTHRAAHFIRRHVQTPIGCGAPPIIAILAFTDTVTSVCLILGLIRAGYQSFWLSTRNSVAGICHLLDAVGASELIVHSDGPLRSLATAAVAESKKPVHLVPLPAFGDLFPEDTSSFQLFQSPPFKGPDTPAIIMHSSGSTSFPKPRTFTHRILLQQSYVPWFGHVDICNEILSVHAVPMFHAQGLFDSCLPLSTGLTLSIFPPDKPTMPPTPERLIHSLVATNSTMLICVPSFLEYWAQNSESVRALSKLKAIFCGGAPLNQISSAIYRASHAQIICYLAATEYGIATLMVPKRAVPEGSEWLTFSPHLTPLFLPQNEPEIYELVFLSSPTHTPGVINTQIEGRGAYATSDLFSRHPSNPDLWKVHGRTDDQIMLSTGEKTNPGPIEAIIGQSPHVRKCLMFGRGRFQNGIIIQPSEAFDPSDIEALSKFRNDIWPAVEDANKFAPSHSRIFKEMIIVSHPSKPFESTLKNTPKRHLTIVSYQEEIEAVYAAVAESAQEDIPPPILWTLENTIAFLRRVVSEVFTARESLLGDDDDLFSQGVDSLQATWIRNSILRALRESSKLAAVNELPLNFVYEHPSISALTRYLVNLVAGHTNTGTPGDCDTTPKLRQMERLVAKYTTNFPARPIARGKPARLAKSGEVIVLTGSTGSLGCQILASLVQDASVTRVYALNRRGAIPVKERQATMWADHSLDPLLLRSDKIVFVDFDATEGLGVERDVSNEIRTSATIIIHNAWTVDFNLTLSSFEPNVRALRTLIDLALQSPHTEPPRFIFTSTIGVVRNWTSPSAVPEAPVSDMTLSIGSGYTESKCVAERILRFPNTGLRAIVVRVGQLAGAPNGSWRTSEWVPAMINSGRALDALPDVQGDVSWIPLQAAALGLLEVARTDASAPDAVTFIHLVHPRPVPWRTVFEPVADMLGSPLVPYDEWLQRLEQSAASGAESPAVRLLGFFKGARLEEGGRGDAMGFPRLETKETVIRAPNALGSGLEVLGPEDVQRWIGHWRRKRFLE